MHNDDWDLIALHVGTRSKEECIATFLRLPIEEPFLEQSVKETGTLGYVRQPWSKEDNPVLGVMALLAETVGNEVAAQAAGKGVRELEEELRRGLKEGAGEGEKEDTSMDLDTTTTTSNQDEDKDKKPTSLALTSLITASTRAHLLALEEDSTLHTLVTSLVSTQLTKLQLKLDHFNSLESLLEVERRGVEKQRQELDQDKIRLGLMRRELAQVLERAKMGAVVPGEEISRVMEGGGGGGGQVAVGVQQPGVAPGVGQAGFARLG